MWTAYFGVFAVLVDTDAKVSDVEPWYKKANDEAIVFDPSFRGRGPEEIKSRYFYAFVLTHMFDVLSNGVKSGRFAVAMRSWRLCMMMTRRSWIWY